MNLFLFKNIFNKYSIQNFKSNLAIQYLNILVKTIHILIFENRLKNGREKATAIFGWRLER